MYKILSIDAWGNAYDGYTWNNYKILGASEIVPISNKDLFDLIALMVGADFLDKTHEFYVDDDGYNIVVCLKENLKPIYAIEYGSVDDDV